jgi:ABC-2 type transport system ATP-binding protein
VIQIEMTGLAKRFGRQQALRDLTLTASAGRITGMLGANGAGKTTALRVLVGLVHSDRGRAVLDGREYRELADPPRTVGFVGEDVRFHPARTARSTLDIAALSAAVPGHRVEAMLRRVELWPDRDRPTGELSLGMRQRLRLGCALLAEPAALVLDEPMNGLDPQGIRWLREVLREHVAAGGTVLLSSHMIAELESTIDYVVIVHHGTTLRQAPLSELVGDGNVVVSARDAAGLRAALDSAGLGYEADGPRFWVDAADPEAVSRACAGVPLTELRASARRLEDVYVDAIAAA